MWHLIKQFSGCLGSVTFAVELDDLTELFLPKLQYNSMILRFFMLSDAVVLRGNSSQFHIL